MRVRGRRKPLWPEEEAGGKRPKSRRPVKGQRSRWGARGRESAREGVAGGSARASVQQQEGRVRGKARRARRSRPTGFASFVASCETPMWRVGGETRSLCVTQRQRFRLRKRVGQGRTHDMDGTTGHPRLKAAESAKPCHASPGSAASSGFDHMRRPCTRRLRRGGGVRDPWSIRGYPCHPCEIIAPTGRNDFAALREISGAEGVWAREDSRIQFEIL